MRTVFAFLRRDYLSWASYRVAVVWQVLTLFVYLALALLVSRTLGSARPDFLARYNTDYLGFVLTSAIFVDVWSIGFVLPQVLRESQAMGTLEAMLLSHVGIVRLLVYSASFPLVMRLTRLVFFSIAAVTLFGLWHDANIISAIVVFTVSMAVMVWMGVLSAGFVLVVKQGDPIIAIYGIANALFAGVFVPRDVMPDWLQAISNLLPLTHALEAMRRALQGETLDKLAPAIIGLSFFWMALTVITVWTLGWAVRRAKEEGSLVQY